MLRRRTYTKGFNSAYGYFMRNISYWVDYGSSNAYHTGATQYVYTKCNLPESPVGNFPISTRTADTASCVGYNASASNTSCAVGYTVSNTTIIVATAKYLYKSTNKGSTFSKVTTTAYNTDTYIYKDFGPIVWADNSKYYVVYASLQASTFPTYINIKFWSCNHDGSGISVSYETVYASASSVYNIANGSQYYYKVSPKGQVCLCKSFYTNNKEMVILDIPNKKISNSTSIGALHGEWRYDMVGEWFDDGTTYGAFYSGGSPSYTLRNHYKIEAKSITTSGLTITKSTLDTQLSYINNNTDNTYAGDTLDGQGTPIILIASALKLNVSRYFIYASRVGAGGTFFICDRNFLNIQILAHAKDIDIAQFWGNKVGWPCGIHVTPDEKWGVVISNEGNLVFDLVNKSYWGGANFNNFNPGEENPYADNNNGFMLPNYTILS